MSDLDDAMQTHMSNITLNERRPFSYIDFLNFEVDGISYGIKHGTFRNKISRLRKCGKVVMDYNSGLAFYTLKGYKFGKAITPNHTGVHSNPIYKMLRDLPFEKQSIHDIRLKLKVPNLWNTLKDNPELRRNKRSKDLLFPTYSREGILIRVSVHKTDTVSIIIGCSLNPIPLDWSGSINFFTLLTRIEEQLRIFVINNSSSSTNVPSIPNYKEWIVTMWHFGRDSFTEYTGEKYLITVADAQGIITRIYSKDMKNGRMKIRIEAQECPKETLVQAIEQKLNSI